MKAIILTLILVACNTLWNVANAETKLEAENASYSNCVLISDSKYSSAKALRCEEKNAKITFTFNAPAQGKYTIYVAGEGSQGEKTVNISVNGSTSTFKLNTYGETDTGTCIMKAGNNTITITPNWTWYYIDYIRITESSSSLPFNISSTPVDANASAAAKKLYTFLLDNFGKKTISGIMTGDMKSANGNITQHDDVKAVYQASGKYPMLIGFDFMNATGKSAESNSWNEDYTRASVNLAKDTWKRGGIPAFTWHWRDPSRVTNEFYTNKSSIKITSAMNSDGSWNTSSTLYKNLIKDIDKVAGYFLEMQTEGIACIFRPLHEASGGWFWWGRSETGAAGFRKLYQLIYHEMTEVKGVHNVIWVWNAGADDADWNPGNDIYDVISADIYNNDYDYSSNYAMFDKLKKLSDGKKIIALSENGPIPDIDKQIAEEAMWSWWMPWYQTWGGNFVSKTSNAEWKKCMSSPYVITLEDHADWNASSVTSLHITDNADGCIYDIHGRQLTKEPSKGIYIRNGKKVMKR